MNRFDQADRVTSHIRDEKGASYHIPYTHLNSPTVLELQSGAMLSVLKIQGMPFETEKTSDINNTSRSWHRALSLLDDNYAVVGTIWRKKESLCLHGKFNNEFATHLDQQYSKQFKDKSLYTNELYLTIISKSLAKEKAAGGVLSRLMSKVSGNQVKQARSHFRAKQMKLLGDMTFQLNATLSAFKPRILGEQDEALGYSELLSFISVIINAGETLDVEAPNFLEHSNQQSKYLYSSPGKTLSEASKLNQKYPYGNVASVLPKKRLFFGEYIQFQGAQADDVRFGAIVTIKRYGNSSASIMLDPLLHLDAEFISTNSFLFESKRKSDEMISRHGIKLSNANDPGVSQIEQLSELRDSVASDEFTMGYHHNTIMLLADCIEALEVKVASAIKCYLDAGYVAVRETLGQEAAFWAGLPGNFKYIARASLVTSKNFADFFPLHNYHTGYRDNNHLGDAMTLIETPSRTPLWLNLHAKGPKDDPSPGHTTLIGGSGSGKTTSMCFFDAQLGRYGGSSFFFDRNRSAEIYTRASCGQYDILSPENQHIRLNPLQLPDTAINRKFCKEWLIQLIRKEEENEVSDEIELQLSGCIDYAYSQLAPRHRTLTHATKILPIHFKRWSRLKKWLKGENGAPDGEYAYLFDNEEDALSLGTKMGFDMTHFLDNEPSPVIVALTMYLFHRIEMKLEHASGRLTSLFLDEAWQYLDNPYWKTKLKKWLPTLRKYNCHIIFATQSPETVAHSPINNTILDNCATNIYFANPQAKPEHYIDGFNLTQSEFAFIKNNEPSSRLFLYKQGHNSMLGRLNLSALSSKLPILSGNIKNVHLLDQIRIKHGDNPKDWLPVFIKESRAAQ